MDHHLVDHLKKCRCCLKLINSTETSFKITKTISIRFFNLTNLELNSTNVYSKLVCSACDEQLKNFSILQKDFITKQLKLQKFVGESEEKQRSKEIDIKDEVNDIYNTVYLNPLVIIKSEPELDSLEICNYEDESKELNYSNTHSSEFKEVKKRIRHMPEVERKRKGQRKSNDPNNLFCPYCDKWFKEKRKVTSHIKRMHTESKNHSCDLCGYKGFGKYEVFRHMKVNHLPREILNAERVLCPECGDYSMNSSTLRKHMRTKHLKIKKYSCDLCECRYYEKNKLRRHIMNTHAPKELRATFPCDECGIVLVSRGSLKTHKLIHAEKQFKCFCGKEFRQRGTLNTHVRGVHNREKRFQCKICDGCFFDASYLKKHTVLVHGEKQEITCHVCGKTMCSESSLKIHMKSHEEPKFQCEVCFRKFHRLPQLQDHMEAHTTLEFPCAHCSRSFRKEAQLNHHLKRVHFKERTTYKCELCASSFSRKHTYRDHVIKNHNTQSAIMMVALMERIKNAIPEEKKNTN